jgi:hypothetical protein
MSSSTRKTDLICRRGALFLSHKELASHTREYALGESACPIIGCALGKDHNGPCVDRFGEEGTIEIRERNLMLLMQDDPEGFKRRVRALLALKTT